MELSHHWNAVTDCLNNKENTCIRNEGIGYYMQSNNPSFTLNCLREDEKETS